MDATTENQLLRLAPILMSLCQSLCDSDSVAEPGFRGSFAFATLRAPSQQVNLAPITGGDFPPARCHPLPINSSGLVSMRRLQLYNSPGEYNFPSVETLVLRLRLVHCVRERYGGGNRQNQDVYTYMSVLVMFVK